MMSETVSAGVIMSELGDPNHKGGRGELQGRRS